MKKIFIILWMTIYSCYALSDGAFGTHERMTKEDLESKGVKLLQVNDNSYISESAPVINDNFRLYKFIFKNKTNKLCNVTGFGRLIKTDEKGTKLWHQFLKIRDILSEKYGDFEIINFYTAKKDQDYIMKAVINNKKSSTWMIAVPDKNNSSSIIVTSVVESEGSGRVDVQYMLNSCDEDINAEGL